MMCLKSGIFRDIGRSLMKTARWLANPVCMFFYGVAVVRAVPFDLHIRSIQEISIDTVGTTGGSVPV
jgi:hypothetical protein